MEAVTCPRCDEVEAVYSVEVRGVYDGALFWACGGCGNAWPIDHGIEARNAAAVRYAAEWEEASTYARSNPT